MTTPRGQDSCIVDADITAGFVRRNFLFRARRGFADKRCRTGACGYPAMATVLIMGRE